MSFLKPIVVAFLMLPFYAHSVVTGEQLLKQANHKIVNIDATALQEQIKVLSNTVLIDVRTQFEVKQLGTIGLYQNVNVPRGWLEFRIAESVVNLETPIVVYCGTNVRSPVAVKTLQDMGYRNVKNYSASFVSVDLNQNNFA